MAESPSNSTSRSQASSLSHSGSQSRSMPHEEITLDTLVSHLLASKRSLSSISTVWRANEIVTSTRTALEESVVLNARTGFLRSGISEQVKILKKARISVESVYKEGQRDFKTVIRALDVADNRLKSTMDTLRSTMVAAAFRPEKEEPRSLLDFVDEKSVETLQDTIKDLIRDTQEAQTQFDTAILSFDDDLRALKVALRSPTTSQSRSELSSPIPPHMNTLETHAQEMALLLNSLVSHFDLCVDAIRHTEGGYAAVQRAASSQPPGAEPVSVSGVMNPDQDASTKEGITDKDRQEMLDVLMKDASQVDDVVLELRERLGEMENMHEAIQEHVADFQSTYTDIKTVYHTLESVGGRLPNYIIASHDFRIHWEETKLNIQEQLTELESMRLFYENYHSSYDNLILEVQRRKSSEDKVKNIMRKAMEQIEKVYENDAKEREGFRIDVGDFLPVDLWPGVNTKAPRWQFGPVNDSEGQVPELDKAVVEAADRRERERKRSER